MRTREIRLGDDLFEVDADRYEQVEREHINEEGETDWTKVCEWVELNGELVGHVNNREKERVNHG